MENKGYYTLREILLGLRDEYINNQQQLQQLKQFCEMDGKKAIDFNFRVFRPENMKPLLLCDFDPKENKLQKIIAEFNKKTGQYSYPNQTANLVKDNNRYYFLCKTLDFPVRIKSDYGMDSEFVSLADSILDSEFSNGIDSKYITNNLSLLNAALTIDSSSVVLYVKDNLGKIPASVLSYDAQTDRLDYFLLGARPTKEQFEMALDVRIPSEELNEYHINAIENNKAKNEEKPYGLRKKR